MIALRKVNIGIGITIVAICLYVLVLPLLPALTFRLKKHAAQATSGIPYKTTIAQETDKNDQRKPVPQDNRLIIPALALDEHVYEGSSPYLVHKGVWARPLTSTPAKGGNTVMVAHRFTYNGPATFYHLDKIIIGDRILVYWQGEEYDYAVTSIKTVAATAVEIENPTKDPQLTLYTCTPLWSAKDRLVVIAKLVSEVAP